MTWAVHCTIWIGNVICKEELDARRDMYTLFVAGGKALTLEIYRHKCWYTRTKSQNPLYMSYVNRWRNIISNGQLLIGITLQSLSFYKGNLSTGSKLTQPTSKRLYGLTWLRLSIMFEKVLNTGHKKNKLSRNHKSGASFVEAWMFFFFSSCSQHDDVYIFNYLTKCPPSPASLF